MKKTDLERFMAHHTPSCGVHVYSGPQRCTCGRDGALKEVQRLQAVEQTLTRLPGVDQSLDVFEKNASLAQPDLATREKYNED